MGGRVVGSAPSELRIQVTARSRTGLGMAILPSPGRVGSLVDQSRSLPTNS